jgi:hypothetical protein
MKLVCLLNNAHILVDTDQAVHSIQWELVLTFQTAKFSSVNKYEYHYMAYHLNECNKIFTWNC